MKKKIVVLAISLCAFLVSFGQKSDTLSLKDLEIPGSPGFILLDKTPTSIERPNSSKAFVLSALNSFTDNHGLPQNYAVEFTPFWFFKHPNMTSYKYMGYNKASNKQNALKDFKKMSFSLAFVSTTDSTTKNQINNVALGMRTTILSVRSKQDIKDFETANLKVVTYLRHLNDRLNEAGIFYPIPADTSAKWLLKKKEYDDRVFAFLTQEEIARKNDKNELAEILKRRALFAVDGALGYNHFFPDNNYSSGHFGRFGAWLTMNYSQILDKKSSDKNYLNIYAIGRYLSDGTKMEDDKYVVQNFYDFGGKIELEFRKISVAYEYIHRINDNTNTFRSNGILKYKLTDQLFLTGAFGKNFGNNNNLISILGLNWGLSSGNEQAKIIKD
jgi:hypothetical protein